MDFTQHDVPDDLVRLVMANSSGILDDYMVRTALSFLTPAQQQAARWQLQQGSAPVFGEIQDLLKWSLSLHAAGGNVIGFGTLDPDLLTYRHRQPDYLLPSTLRPQAYIPSAPTIPRVHFPYIYTLIWGAGGAAVGWGVHGFGSIPNDPLTLLLLLVGALIGAYVDCRGSE